MQSGKSYAILALLCQMLWLVGGAHTSAGVLVPYRMTVRTASAPSAGHGISTYVRFLPPALTTWPKLCQRASYAALRALTLPCISTAVFIQ